MKITTMLAAVLFNITLADIFYAACPCATLAEKTAAIWEECHCRSVI